ncbi:fic family toxin-antitoxin system, toxin component [Streptomyces sp. WZ.A104]|uniref:fic family toxin-antitoxin system, toxin component n=1 Tax=Streptomyces sp. WZ.A104 TaxID=2023771 RepID=UPI00211C8992|nr:fic family toxin-antitoxin system, toxin component [Streptomyces sp. WZ.A104]
MKQLSIDLSWILDVAREAGHEDPAILDYGVAIAAVERHRAIWAEITVYDGPFVRAAALAHTLGRLRWLERSNVRVAIAVAYGYLLGCDLLVKLDQPKVSALAIELRNEECTAERIAALLRTWTT